MTWRGYFYIKVTGVYLLRHQVKGLSVTNFLKKGGSLDMRLHKIRAFIKFFSQFSLGFAKTFL